MSIWKKLFGGSKPSAPATPKIAPVPTPPSAQPASTGKGYVVLSGTIDNMEPMMRAGAALGTLQYDGGPVEPFYERMSRDLISKHGPLVGVDYVSHFPKFEIWFCYRDGTRIYSGQRTGHYDIHFMSLGYAGEGPRYARHFLAAAGFDLTSEQIESIKPGDSIQLKDGKAVIVREKDKVVESDEVTFDREVKGLSMGFPATYSLYKGPNKDAAMAFLEKQNITAQSYFVGVKTPEGTFCKDRMGIFDAPTPNWPNRKRTSYNWVQSKDRVQRLVVVLKTLESYFANNRMKADLATRAAPNVALRAAKRLMRCIRHSNRKELSMKYTIIIMLIIIALAINLPIIGCSNATHGSQALAPLMIEDRGWGFIDQTGKWVIQPQYEDAHCFSQGLAAVKMKEKWGFVNVKGKMRIQPIYDDVAYHGFNEGLAAVEIDGKWKYIDLKGNVAIDSSFTRANRFSEGIASVKQSWLDDSGYINKAGEYVVKPKFYSTRNFINSVAIASSKKLLPNGMAVLGGYGLIDKKGNWVVPPKYSYLESCGEYIVFSTHQQLSKYGDILPSKPYGFIDQQGKIVIEPKYDYAGPFSEGLGIVMIHGKYGYIDELGNEIIEPRFENVRPFFQGLAAVKINNKWGFIDKSGQLVIQAMFNDVSDGFTDANAR